MSDQPTIESPPVIAETCSVNRNGNAAWQSEKPLSTVLQSQGYSSAAACVWLCGSLSILLLASILSVGRERRVYLPGLSFPMPETCMLHARFGLDCPGCGLTRSFIHFAHGRLIEGLSLNPAGIVIFLFVVAQLPAAILRFAQGQNSRSAILWSRFNEIAIIVLPTLTFAQWIVRFSIGDLP